MVAMASASLCKTQVGVKKQQQRKRKRHATSKHTQKAGRPPIVVRIRLQPNPKIGDIDHLFGEDDDDDVVVSAAVVHGDEGGDEEETDGIQEEEEEADDCDGGDGDGGDDKEDEAEDEEVEEVVVEDGINRKREQPPALVRHGGWRTKWLCWQRKALTKHDAAAEAASPDARPSAVDGEKLVLALFGATAVGGLTLSSLADILGVNAFALRRVLIQNHALFSSRADVSEETTCWRLTPTRDFLALARGIASAAAAPAGCSSGTAVDCLGVRTFELRDALCMSPRLISETLCGGSLLVLRHSEWSVWIPRRGLRALLERFPPPSAATAAKIWPHSWV